MPKAKTFSLKGTVLVETVLPKEFGVKENLRLLAQAVRVYEERSHVGLAKTKTRSEINRTTKKWYKQKGTGGARHGARSAPIFVGGGVAHGPKAERRELTLGRKMAQKALGVALSLKLSRKEVVVVDGLAKLAKVKEGATLITKIAKTAGSKGNNFTFVLAEKNLPVRRYLRNIKGVGIFAFKSLNAYEVFRGGILIFDKSIFEKK